MATWTRVYQKLTAGTNSDLTGRMTTLVSGATAPADFDPAGVTSVKFECDVTGSGFTDDDWDGANSTPQLYLSGTSTGITGFSGMLSYGAGGGGQLGFNNQNETKSYNDTNGDPSTAYSTAQWEACELGSTTDDNVALYVASMKADGGQLTMTDVTVTITYTPLTFPETHHTMYRWYDDWPSEGGTALEALDTAHDLTVSTGTVELCLINMTEQDSPAGAQDIPTPYDARDFQYRINTGAWTNLSNSGTVLLADNAGTEGAFIFSGMVLGASTGIATGPAGGMRYDLDNYTTDNGTADTPNSYSENHLYIGVNTNALSASDTVEFRLDPTYTYIDATYTQIVPTLNIVAGGTTTPKAISAGLTLTGSVTTALAYVKAITQGLTLTPSYSRTLTAFRTITQGLTLSPTVSRALTAFRSITQGLTLSPSDTKAHGRSTSSGLTLTPSVATAKFFYQAVSAGLTLAGSVASKFGKAIAASLTLSPVVDDLRSFFHTVSWGINLTPAIVKNTAKSLSQGLTLSPTVASAKAFFESVAASLSLTPSDQKNTSKGVSNGLTLSPTVADARTFFRSVSASLGHTVAILRDVFKGDSQSLAFAPSVAMQVSRYENVNVGLTLTGSVGTVYTPAGGTTYYENVSVGMTLTPTITKLLTLSQDISISLTVTPTVTTQSDRFRSVSQGLALTPAVDDLRSFLWSVPTSLTLSSTIQRAMTIVLWKELPLSGSVTDTLATTEAVSSGATLTGSVSTTFIPAGTIEAGGDIVAGPGEVLKTGKA